MARADSKASLPLNSTPSSAPRPVPTRIAAGVARPRAQGQAMIRTATPLRRAVASSASPRSQPTNVAEPIARTTGAKTPATRSTSFCTGALEACASSTSLAMRARAVSRPTRVASTTTRPSWLTVAPKTPSPGPLSTGSDSPVSMLSSKEERPSTMVPSVGIFSPGRTTIRSPGSSWSTGTAISLPSRSTRASFSPSSSSRVTACEARPLARASRKRPVRIRVMITAAVSKKTASPAARAQSE